MTFQEHLALLDKFLIETKTPKNWRLAFMINYYNWYKGYRVTEAKFQDIMKEIT